MQALLRRFLLSLAAPIAATFVLAAFCALLLHLAGATLTVSRLAALWGGGAVVVGAGHVLLLLTAPTPFAGQLVAKIVVGYAATTMALLFGVFIAGAGIATSFLVWSLLVLVALAATLGREYPRSLKLAGLDLVLLAVTAATVAFFCRDIARAIPTIEAQGLLPAWIDYFIHGAEIAQFGAVNPNVTGDILLSGVSLPLYHYGIFLLPGLIRTLFDLSGLAVACAILLPLGLLFGLATIVTLATRLGGLSAGVLALALTLLLPIATGNEFMHGMFSVHWLVLTAPGTGYAVAVAATALILAERTRIDGWRALVMALFLTFSLFQIRAHIFVLFAPPFLVACALESPLGQKRWRSLLVLSVIGAAAILLLAAVWTGLRDFVSHVSAASQFLDSMAPEIDNTLRYRDLYAAVAAWPHTLANFGRAVLLLPLILGYLTILLPLAIAVDRPNAGLKRADVFFVLLLLAQLLLLAVAPAGPQGDVSEYAHRPFPLVVAAAVALTAAHAVHAVKVRWPHFIRPGAYAYAAALVAVSGASGLAAYLIGFDPARPQMTWARSFYRPAVDPGVLALSDFLSKNMRPDETIAVGPIDQASTLVDLGTIIAGLANRSIYLTNPTTQITLGGTRGEETKRRLVLQKSIDGSFTSRKHEAAMRAGKITWYLDARRSVNGTVHAPDGAVFVNSFGRVYHIEP